MLMAWSCNYFDATAIILGSVRMSEMSKAPYSCQKLSVGCPIKCSLSCGAPAITLSNVGDVHSTVLALY